MAYNFKLKEPLTLDKVKACIEMPEPFGSTLRQMCDIWYKMELDQGRGEEGAAEIVLDKLGQKMLELAK